MSMTQSELELQSRITVRLPGKTGLNISVVIIIFGADPNDDTGMEAT